MNRKEKEIMRRETAIRVMLDRVTRASQSMNDKSCGNALKNK